MTIKQQGGVFGRNPTFNDVTIDGTLTVAGNVSVDGGTIKLDGNYPVGTGNVALGDTALDSNVSGNYNTAIGADALTANTADKNTAIGYQAGYAATTEGSSVYVGYQAGVAANGLFNTFVGTESGHGVTSGAINTFVGYDSGSEITTGSKNVIIGNYNGNEGGLDIRTSSNNIVLSDGDGNPRLIGNSDGNFCIGGTTFGAVKLDVKTTVTANYAGYFSFVAGGYGLGVSNTSGGAATLAYFFSPNYVGEIFTNGLTTSYLSASDYRLKENVIPLAGAADRLAQIPVRRFNFIADPDTTVDGFLAHEVQDIVPEAITGTKDEVDADGNPKYQGIDQSKLVPLLTAALQEALTEIASLKARLDAANL